MQFITYTTSISLWMGATCVLQTSWLMDLLCYYYILNIKGAET